MQTYIHAGLGFPASLLTDAQADMIWDKYGSPDEKVGVFLCPYTEDYDGKSWATIVVKPYGKIKNSGKMTSVANLASQSNAMKLTNDETKIVMDILDELKITHLFKEINPIIYSDNY